MILRQPVLRAVVVLAIVAPKRKVNFDATCSALRKLRLPGLGTYAPTLPFNVGIHIVLWRGVGCPYAQPAARSSRSWKSVNIAANYSVIKIMRRTWHSKGAIRESLKKKADFGENAKTVQTSILRGEL